MEQHPVPQQISSYQFRLVGDMTLKQFFQLAGGGLIALLVYASPFPAFIKWPLIIIFVAFGAALAFLPIEERPLEVWIIAFFRSIYAPTVFYWKKASTPPVYFLPETVASSTTTQATPGLSASPPQAASVARLEEAEQSFLSKLTSIFSLPHSAPAASPPAQPKPAAPPPPPPTPPQPMAVPPAPPVNVVPKPVYTAPVPQQPIAPAPVQTTAVNQTLATSTPGVAQAAQFSAEAAPPMPPSSPNIIVGQVMDNSGKIVEGAILEITDTANRPVRALKTNKAGHFLIVTPLVNGTYQLTIEKPGLTFEPLTFTATGEIIQPLAIKATGQQQTA